jgi:hypothetical protein
MKGVNRRPISKNWMSLTCPSRHSCIDRLQQKTSHPGGLFAGNCEARILNLLIRRWFTFPSQVQSSPATATLICSRYAELERHDRSAGASIPYAAICVLRTDPGRVVAELLRGRGDLSRFLELACQLKILGYIPVSRQDLQRFFEVFDCSVSIP